MRGKDQRQHALPLVKGGSQEWLEGEELATGYRNTGKARIMHKEQVVTRVTLVHLAGRQGEILVGLRNQAHQFFKIPASYCFFTKERTKGR